MLGFGKLKNKALKIQGPGVGLAASPLLSPEFKLVQCFILFNNMDGGGRCCSLFQVHLLIFLGHPIVFIPGAFINPRWTLLHQAAILSKQGKTMLKCTCLHSML